MVVRNISTSEYYFWIQKISFSQHVFNLFILYYSGDHTEVIEIDFDPETIAYKDLLKLFWNNHEYGLITKVKRQVGRRIENRTNCIFQLSISVYVVNFVP